MFAAETEKAGPGRDFRERTSVIFDPNSTAALEQYRALALTLEQSVEGGKSRVLLVTSALSGEGKTLTAGTLALTLSDSFNRRVLLVDGDFRNPTVDKAFGSRGIFEKDTAKNHALPPGVKLGMTLGQCTPNLMVLGRCGGVPLDPLRLLNSPDMRLLLTWARERFDWVLVDSPPALMPDAVILAQLADGVLFVVSSASTPYEAARRAIDNVGKHRVVGAVMNRLSSQDDWRTLEYMERARSHSDAS